MAHKIFDANRLAVEQQSHISAAAEMGLTALKLVMQLQASMLRLWAGNIEGFADNCEKTLKKPTAGEGQSEKERAA